MIKLHGSNVPHFKSLRIYLEDGETKKQLLKQLESGNHKVEPLLTFINIHGIEMSELKKYVDSASVDRLE